MGIEEILKACAYHESGRIVFTYQCAYGCDGVELSEIDSGMGISKLNGYHDSEFIQAIFSNNKTIIKNFTDEVIEVAKKLMKIYCAGSCVENYYQNNLSKSGMTEIEIAGQDAKNIELLQQFLKQQISNHPDDYPSKIMVQIFDEIVTEKMWKPIETLAERIIKAEDKKLNRFYIEDALMMAGFRMNKKIIKSAIAVREEENKKVQNQALSSIDEKIENNQLLDKALIDFLKLVKKDWQQEELTLSISHLKMLFKRFE